MKTKIVTILVSILCILLTLSTLILTFPKDIKATYNIYGSPLALTEKTNDDYEEQFYDATIAWSTASVVAEFNGFSKETDERGIWNFKCEKVIFGEVESETIIITSLLDEGDIYADTYKVGEHYLLFLNRDNSVFYDTVRYSLSGGVCISLDNIGKGTWSKGTVTFSSAVSDKDIVNYYKKMADEKGYLDNQFEKKVFRNESIETVIENCECVYKIKVIDKMLDGKLADNSTYYVEINEALKGGEYILDGASNYLLHVSKDSLEADKEYIVALSLISDQADKFQSFVQAADNGIISLEETDKVNTVYGLLE